VKGKKVAKELFKEGWGKKKPNKKAKISRDLKTVRMGRQPLNRKWNLNGGNGWNNAGWAASLHRSGMEWPCFVWDIVNK
jgi:hypothetical protein